MQTKGRTALAMEAIQDELLRECDGMPAADPGNTVWELLQDGTTAMSLLAECRKRNGKLIEYIRPIVDAERKR